MISTAFVLGAGLGTRLRPLTSVRPKPLIPVCNRPLITYAFDHLLGNGVERFVVNTHWLADAFRAEFPTNSHRTTPIAFRNEAPEILETAGGIKNVEDLLGNQPFIVYNGDVLCDFSLEPLLASHLEAGNEVTLALRSKDGPLQVAMDGATGQVTDIGGKLQDERNPRYLFTGIYVVNPAFLARIPPRTKIGVVPLFLEMIRTRARLGGVICDDGMWWDLGSRSQYLLVHRHFAERPALAGLPPWIAAETRVSSDVELRGATAVGHGAVIGAGARLEDSIIWPGAEVAAGAELTRCIVTGALSVGGVHMDTDL